MTTTEMPTMDPADKAELERLMQRCFGSDEAGARDAARWLRAEIFDLRAKPIDVLARGPAGVKRVLDWLREVAPQ